MQLVGQLARGLHGVQIDLPGWTDHDVPGIGPAIRNSELDMNVHVRTSGRYLSLEKRLFPVIAQDAARAARVIFETIFDHLLATGDFPPGTHRRTNNPAWSPLVSCEVGEIDGVTVLETIHRGVYMPGREVIMGHLLIPTRQGILELSCPRGRFPSRGRMV